MFGKHADLAFLRIIDTRAFVQVVGYTTKLQSKAWEGVLVGYDSDKPTFHVYDRCTGRISSSRNVSFIEEPLTVLPTAGAGGQEPEIPDFDLEPGSDFMDDYQSMKHGTSSLETNDTDATGNKPFHMSLRSSTSQAKARQLAVTCQDSPIQQSEAVSQYIGAVGMDNINPPASISVPNTYAQAMASPQAGKWEAAMRKELKSLDEHEVADLIPFTKVSPGCSIIGTRWVFRVKTDGRFEARLMVQGWAQQHGLDCFTTFAPVCRVESQHLLLAIAASRDWRVLAMDVQTAFLNEKLEEEVYTKQAPGFETIDERTNRPLVMKLRKSFYGLRQSPSVWNSTIDKDLRKMGFTPTASDSCVYTKGSGNTYIKLTLFVDDLLITEPSNASMAGVRRVLLE